MQAVIALCYFCENHGPRIVMTCQPMRGSNSQTDNPCRFHADEAMETDAEIPQYYGDTIDEIVDEEERCSACSSFGSGLGILSNDHQAETSYISTQMPISERLYQMIKQSCLRSLSVEISTPLLWKLGLTTLPQPQMRISMFYQLQGGTSERYFLVENSSKEDKDGVVLFGDDENGYTLSMTFRLRDAKARVSTGATPSLC
uniref:Folliculin/SMCR8 longin domain-containing protein n=1 Tax=Ditylenchus dipsaci TaxID=166011 RepID=A0A915CUA4_9BILA